MRSVKVIQLAYADKTADWRTKWIEVQGYDIAEIWVNVTSLTGTSPTLDPKVEVTYLDADGRPGTEAGSAYYDTLDLTKQTVEGSAWTQFTAANIQKRTITYLTGFLRIFFDLGGVVTDCDVELTIILRS